MKLGSVMPNLIEIIHLKISRLLNLSNTTLDKNSELIFLAHLSKWPKSQNLK